MTIAVFFLISVALSYSIATREDPIKVVNVGVLELCVPGAAPIGGTWQVIEKNVKKVCPPGSSCRKGACNCDNLSDGTIMTHSPDKDSHVCRRVAGQKCSSDDQCHSTTKCTEGVCTCIDKNDCVHINRDVAIYF